MLPEEFYNRTHITLSAEDYTRVERLYNTVHMDKDEFCRCWVSEKENPLFKELAAAYLREEDINRGLADTVNIQRKQLKEKDKFYNDELNKASKRQNEHFVDFVKKVILSGNIIETDNLYEVIAEECGMDFIIKTKHEAGFCLSDGEISYLVDKI